MNSIARHDSQKPGENRRDGEDPEENCFPTGQNHKISDCGMRISDWSLRVRTYSSAIRIPHSAMFHLRYLTVSRPCSSISRFQTKPAREYVASSKSCVSSRQAVGQASWQRAQNMQRDVSKINSSS